MNRAVQLFLQKNARLLRPAARGLSTSAPRQSGHQYVINKYFFFEYVVLSWLIPHNYVNLGGFTVNLERSIFQKSIS